MEPPTHVFECPECGTTDAADLDECPHCGAIVAKIEAEMMEEEVAAPDRQIVGQPAGLDEKKLAVGSHEIPARDSFSR